MKYITRDPNNSPILMNCVKCRIEGKPIEDCIATFCVDMTTLCPEHFDEWVERNKLA